MPRSVAYCGSDDVTFHFAKVRLPPEIDMTSVIDLASDEMDGYIGYRYVVPIPVSSSDPTKSYGTLMLKTICGQLAAGRIMVSVSSGGEKNATHAYGLYLIQTALGQLDLIKHGKLNISFGTLNTDEQARKQGPMMAPGMDAYSMVDQFYQNTQRHGFAPVANNQPPVSSGWPFPGGDHWPYPGGYRWPYI